MKQQGDNPQARAVTWRARCAMLLWSCALLCCAAAEMTANRGAQREAPASENPADKALDALPSTPYCGNAALTPEEACDDGNLQGGDGCSGNCRRVEAGYSCIPAGQPCHRVARCGDGIGVVPELCDDGNRKPGDGCSPDCKIEIGWKCAGSPSHCTATQCGDGKVEGAESCDDGNAQPYDGCSADCQNEPTCKDSGCASNCGDGIVIAESCDDGNNVDGDGCSAKCQVEAGYECKQPALGDRMIVPIVLRDFRYGHPMDFQPNATGRMAADTGIVERQLDGEGRPVYTGKADSFVTSKSTFASWYRDMPGVNSSTVSKLVLWRSDQGAYVNRFGPNGERFKRTKPAYYCGNVGAERLDANGQAIPCTSKYNSDTDCDKAAAGGLEVIDCHADNGSYRATIVTQNIDGNPLFFPVDADPFTPESERSFAQLPAPIYSDDWGKEPGEPKHNFSFTSEVRYWFVYDPNQSYQLEFTGDDDVWVFINKRLAVDLGGIHTPVSGAVSIDSHSAAQFALERGKVYEIAVFQAERQTTSSSYRLTLSGFNAAPSACKPICGDGIVGLGEECDDGVNEGGYGKCGPGCTLGMFCGDGIVQMGESCDDGVNDGQPCPSGCRIIELL